MAIANASAEVCPLKFETIPADEVQAFPGGYGTYGTVRTTKPAKLKKEPAAVSKVPLYGECRQGGSGPSFAFRLDESQGTGKGYDQLLVDLNQNGDLTDETPAKRVSPSKRPGPSEVLYGPLAVPADKQVAGGRPVYYATVYLFNSEMLKQANLPKDFQVGQVRFKAGWYLSATTEVGGVKRKIGLYDGDSNLRVGDPTLPSTYNSGGRENWSFSRGDSLLLDVNNSGKFETDPMQEEACTMSPVFYFGATPLKATLAEDCTSITVEPWTEDLAEVTLQPKGTQVHSVTLAWERPNGKWQLIRPTAVEGKVKVPPGNYRVYGCTLVGKGNGDDQCMVSGTQRTPKKPFTFAAGKANTLTCGAPLQVNLHAEKKTPESWERISKAKDAKKDSDFVLSIQTTLSGTEGEVYSTFLKGAKLNSEPPKPKFTIEVAGKIVGEGSLEYG